MLVLKESNSDTLSIYLEDYLRELIGNKHLIEILKKEPCYISLINKVTYLSEENPSVIIFKKEVFKCINIINQIIDRMMVIH